MKTFKAQVSRRLDDKGKPDEYGQYVQVAFSVEEVEKGKIPVNNVFLISRHMAAQLHEDLEPFIHSKP